MCEQQDIHVQDWRLASGTWQSADIALCMLRWQVDPDVTLALAQGAGGGAASATAAAASRAAVRSQQRQANRRRRNASPS